MFISSKKRIFHYKVWFLLCDAFLICAAIYLAAVLRFGVEGAHEYIDLKFRPLLTSVVIILVVFYLNGLYEPRTFGNYFKLILRIIPSVLVSILLIILVFYARFYLSIGRGVFFLMALALPFLTSIPRMTYMMIAKGKFLDERIIIVGTGDAALDTIKLIEKHPSSLYRVVGIVYEDKEKELINEGNYKTLGYIDNISEIIKHRRVDEIVVTTLEPKRHNILKNLRACRYHGVEIRDAVSLYEELEGQVPLKYIDDEWLFSSSANYPGFHVKKLKRLMDVIGSSLGLAITLPLCLVTAILIRLDSKGPIFYRQKRLGRYGKPFRVLKFRSMIHRAERGLGGPVWSSENDPRITRVGKWIRKMRIDEIPQLINVFLGNMSLVGPRPERPAFVRDLSESILFYPERLYVQPGLTGWAQINFPYTSTIEQSKNKLQYDLYYIKHVSFLLDCRILLKTFKIAFFGRGR